MMRSAFGTMRLALPKPLLKAFGWPGIRDRVTVDGVIAPHETRREVVKALRLLRTKREILPAKKHGNIPL